MKKSQEDLEYYQKLKEQNHPAKMLAVADNWLRKELEKKRALKQQEKASGDMAHALDPTDRQGGYASGRNIQTEVSAPLIRRGTLSDIMGNSGVMDKH